MTKKIEDMTIDELMDRFDELDKSCPIEDMPEYKAIAVELARNLRYWVENCDGG